MSLGIESINAYVGQLSLDVRSLFEARQLDTARFDNLLMQQKSVCLPCEDPVTNGVNASRPLLDELSPEERGSIEAIVVGTESGLDFGKPISTYIHHHLELPRRCRSFEVKHACYGGTAALRTAMGLVALSSNPDAKALAIATDCASAADRNTYWEPSQGAGAVAMVVSRRSDILEIDAGAAGFYTMEVMDTCRPGPNLEAGDSDLSLLSYLECLEHSFAAYRTVVDGADLHETFDYLAFHTPFAGMVKGAHRTLCRRLRGASREETDADFEARLAPSIAYCRRVGNVYSGALYLALCSLIEHGRFQRPKRLGLFSYGSGCASEFYSGVLTERAQGKLARRGIARRIEQRRPLAIDEYEMVADLGTGMKCGVREGTVDTSPYAHLYEQCMRGQGLLVLRAIRDYHREYDWV